MLNKPLALIVIAVAGLMLAPAVHAQVVTGEVTDAAKRIPFKGALVRIEGRQQSTSTDDRGRLHGR